MRQKHIQIHSIEIVQEDFRRADLLNLPAHGFLIQRSQEFIKGSHSITSFRGHHNTGGEREQQEGGEIVLYLESLLGCMTGIIIWNLCEYCVKKLHYILEQQKQGGKTWEEKKRDSGTPSRS